MVQLADLYDADRYARDPVVQDLRSTVQAPHPLHGVDYADGVLICGRMGCRPCQEWRVLNRPPYPAKVPRSWARDWNRRHWPDGV
jgi:hypothetical protein